eukprot:gene5955-7159_t
MKVGRFVLPRGIGPPSSLMRRAWFQEIFHMAPEARQRLPNSMVMRRTQREKQEQRRIRKQLIQLENQLENQRKMGAPMPKMHENVDSRVMEAEQERWISHKLWENSKIALEYGTPGQQLSSFVSNMILVQPPPGSAAHFEGETSACKEDSLLGTPAKASRRAKSLKGCKKTVTVRDGEVATAEDQRLPETPERSPQKCDSSGRDITPQPSPDLVRLVTL